MDSPIRIVPVEGNTNIFASSPILRYFVKLLENTNEMHRMFFSNVFHSEIIDNECERYRLGLVCPQPWYRSTL